MSDDFDPYWAWLGIPLGIRPPSQADLLGVSEHETSPETIAQAADRRMAVVSAMLVTPHAAWAQRLLVEVATARAMLIAGLGSRVATAPTATQAAVPSPATPSQPAAVAPSADDDLLPPVATTGDDASAPSSHGPASYPQGLAAAGYPTQQPQYMPQPATAVPYVPQAMPAGYGYPANYAVPTQPVAAYGHQQAAMAASPTGYASAGAVAAATPAPSHSAEANAASVPGAGGYRSVASAARRRSRSNFNMTVIGGLAVVCFVIVAVILGQMGGDKPSNVSQAPVTPTRPVNPPTDDTSDEPSNDEPDEDAPTEEDEPAPPRDPSSIRPRVVHSSDPEPMEETDPSDPSPNEPTDEMPVEVTPEEDPSEGEMPAEMDEPSTEETGDDAPESTDPSEPEGDEPNPDEPMSENPDMPAPETEPTTDTPMPDEPTETTTPEPEPEPEPTPEPEPAPEPPTQASTKETQLVERAMIAFRANLESREFEAAAEKLDEALLEVTDPELSAKLDRAQSCLYYVREFWEAVSRSVAELKGGQELMLNDEIIIVVEVQPDLLIIRAAGMNRRYRIRQIPPALAYQLADTWLDDDNPTSQVFLAAFLALDGKGDPDRARSMLQNAARDGLESEVQPLLDALDGKL